MILLDDGQPRPPGSTRPPVSPTIGAARIIDGAVVIDRSAGLGGMASGDTPPTIGKLGRIVTLILLNGRPAPTRPPTVGAGGIADEAVQIDRPAPAA